MDLKAHAVKILMMLSSRYFYGGLQFQGCAYCCCCWVVASLLMRFVAAQIRKYNTDFHLYGFAVHPFQVVEAKW